MADQLPLLQSTPFKRSPLNVCDIVIPSSTARRKKIADYMAGFHYGLLPPAVFQKTFLGKARPTTKAPSARFPRAAGKPETEIYEPFVSRLFASISWILLYLLGLSIAEDDCEAWPVSGHYMLCHRAQMQDTRSVSTRRRRCRAPSSRAIRTC